VVLALLLALGAARAEAPPRPDLTGSWVLDRARSEEPRPGARGVGRAPGRSSGPRAKAPLPGGEPLGLAQDFAPCETLVITAEGADLLIESGEGRVLRLRPDGRSWKRENGTVETRAEWKGAELRAESRMARGAGKLVVVYSRPTEAREIVVSLTLDDADGVAQNAHRVYVSSDD